MNNAMGEVAVRAQVAAIVETSGDAIIGKTNDGIITSWNMGAEDIYGYTADEIIGKPATILAPPACHAEIHQLLEIVRNGGVVANHEAEGIRKDGTLINVALSPSPIFDVSGSIRGISIIARDITERKRMEVILRQSERALKEAQRLSHMGSWHLDISTNQVVWSEELYRIFGFEPELPPSLFNESMKLFAHDSWVRLSIAIDQTVKTGISYELELETVQKDGGIGWILTRGELVRDVHGAAVRIQGIVIDITERKKAEAAIAHTSRALATVSAVNRHLVYITDEKELLQSICQAIVERGGYRMAWAGYAQRDADKSIKIMALAGGNEEYLDSLHFTWADSERGMGPAGRAIRSGETQLCEDIANDPCTLSWREAAPQQGGGACIALPLADSNGKIFGVLTVYAEEVNPFSEAEVDLLQEMAGDLAFGVRTLHIRRERDLALAQNQLYLSQLKDSFEDTISVIAGIGELRDPYTAGHQVRVARLATEIARGIGLSEEQVQAIHFASIVHDLGKIQIPTEILSKPGLLNSLEYELIKTHAQAGYDILKDIHFPWPIAQIVLQHHERLDGSGYPQGLKSEEIMFEARIISVADVVEAISSHRPYRPALGIEVALKEMEKLRGKCFDPQAVDTCLALFRENRFAFSA